ncbi:UDP-N-acetylglucosamine 2-epimerase (non-hydrolyzing) [Anaerocolumna cellulosilytica]|uniref:UDP-N-acetylglucosamine 2-epimerase (Non-hydrolyzing) n=1 Tax=Anaerocolumna cellulosilytica TaxID=433286 RepID=A0A6S6R5H1_9FIRM|nr:UDP-N-acetylglucosamine 2-epimerase (non-hydrolyzing) [Anaerocolumna cellulosilytica]MBB5194092.1 UDP-N-acetylglucosamine 2-epimerase (non-hydrolyzing) [Anaerocolumna cellulosilytica]BCJ94692.1 UDP-N-acetylglucosamine 2-epimerase (non-hydrolyzing) [Anaerocolumna cellulosilytica]
MNQLKLMTILGTRPEIIRLSEVIKKCDLYFNHILVHTGQNWDYSLNQIFFEDLNLRQPDIYLEAVGDDLGETIGNIIAKSYQTMLLHKPDALLILGDTNSALSAIAAKRLKIPIFHMEAGNRCFDENLPEETNRKIVDHIADVNLCYSEHARRYLLAEGRPKERTYVTGSPMAEVLTAHYEKINKSPVLETLALKKKNYILLSAHREENIDIVDNFMALMESVNTLAQVYDMPVIYSTHPRSAKIIEERKFHFHYNVRSIKPFNFTDYNHLQKHAYCVVSDSGTLPEEASYFKSFPAVCIRTSTERPEALDTGNFILGSITPKQVLQAVDVAVRLQQQMDIGSDVPDYIEENVSTKIVKLIQSYTGIINHIVWRK